MRSNDPARCGFGEYVSEYVGERFEVPMQADGADVILKLTHADLPRIAKGFELEVGVRGGCIEWTCGICGSLGDTLACDAAKHAEFYHAFELEHRRRRRGARG